MSRPGTVDEHLAALPRVHPAAWQQYVGIHPVPERSGRRAAEVPQEAAGTREALVRDAGPRLSAWGE